MGLVLLLGCGGEAKRNQSTDSATTGTSTTGTSIGGGTTRNTSSTVTTSVGGSGGSGGWGDTKAGGAGGFAASGGSGGSGGAHGCGRNAPQLGACYGVSPAAAGAGGYGGWPEPEIDECWTSDDYQNCSAEFEGKVQRAEFRDDSWSCSAGMLGSTSDLPERRIYSLWLSDGEVDFHVVLGPLERPLDVARGDELVVRFELQRYHADFMFGSRLTVTKDDTLIAVLNSGLPVEDSMQFGEFQLDRGAALCSNPEDDFSCAETWHELNVKLNDASLSLAPYMNASLGNYEVFVDMNQSMHDGGGCDVGDTTNFALFKLMAP